ncbi:MAG: O-antigen ligase family protein [Flavobacterium sp.]|nr:O-antigen ligase family protein [Flavobacterium sp.]
MQQKNTFQYVPLLIIHLLIGSGIFFIPFLSKIYAILIFIVGFIYVVKTQNKNNEVLLVCGYIVGSEVLIRSTDGAFLYEFAKYGTMFFVFIGMFYSGFSKNAIPFWMYIILLIPGVLIGVFSLTGLYEIRNSISNTISGPACLGVVALYTYQRKIHISNLNTILLAVGLPILSHLTYIILFNPSVKDVITGTDSSGITSGGFGPNQVSTILGLGIFIYFSRIILQSKNNFNIILNLFIIAIFAFRSIVTFSRGGVFTAIVMIVILTLNLYFLTSSKGKFKLNFLIIILLMGSVFIWVYSSIQTNGLIQKRYNNQDAAGRVKESKMSGREDLVKSEMNMFFDNPVLGVGVGKSIEIRQEQTGLVAASHNEITRLLAEHGAIGIAILLILFFTPIFLFFDNKQNIFMFPFLLFWLLTINHAAMRIAAPAFVYGLSLLKVYINEPQNPQNGRQVSD